MRAAPKVTVVTGLALRSLLLLGGLLLGTVALAAAHAEKKYWDGR